MPREQQIRGLGPIVISVPTLNPTDVLLTRVFNMRQVRDCPHPDNPATHVHVFEMGGGGAHAELHVAVQPDLPVAQQGAGGVHHVAFRSRDADYDAWADRLNEFRIPNSGKVDRFWFRSLYVREPNGVLFEIATDGPGFGIDEDMSTLGEQFSLTAVSRVSSQTDCRQSGEARLSKLSCRSKHAFFDIIDIEEKLHLAFRLAELRDISLEILLCALPINRRGEVQSFHCSTS